MRVGLAYENLDAATRRFMTEEIDIDLNNGSIYISNYLNPQVYES